MPKATSGKEKAPLAPAVKKALDLVEPKEVVREPLPAQKVLKIFSINIITQGLPFCRRRVSGLTAGWRHQQREPCVSPIWKCQGSIRLRSADLHL